MTDIEAMVREAYERFGKGDIEGLLAMCHDEMMFYVPGSTQVSGDHPRAAFAEVAGKVMALSAGTFREEILEILTSEHGAAVVLHHYLERDGQDVNYHTVHNWTVRGDKFVDFWEYPHEYDQFQKAWS